MKAPGRKALGRRFWRLYVASATSNLADGIGRTALPLLGARLTHNPLLISGLVTFAFLPWLLFALPSGALVDRVDRRRAMAGANMVRAVAMAALAGLVFAHSASIAALYGVAFALGLAETVYDSSVRAILPQVVSAASLDRANGLLTVEETLGQTFVGAPVGSALFAVAAAIPLVLNASGFAVAALVVLTLRGTYRPARTGEPGTVRADIAHGVRWLVAHRLLRGLTVISAVTAFLNSMISGVFVLYVLEVLRLPPGDFGLLLLAGGVGAILGGTATPGLTERFGRVRMLTAGAILSSLSLAAMGFTRDAVVAGALFAASAAGIMVWNVITMSLRQALIPQDMFGRVQGAYRTLVWGSIPAGALAGGALAAAAGLRPVFFVAGSAMLLAGLALGVLCRRHAGELAELPSGEDIVAVTPAESASR